MVNRPVENLEFTVNSSEDYQALRRKWTELPKIPKLVDGHECPTILDTGTQLIRCLLKGEESGGGLMAALVTLKAGGEGAGIHHQPLEDEFWFCHQGQWDWTVGNVTKRVGPGWFAYAPRGTRHAFSLVGDQDGIMFTVNTPAGHERGFQALGKAMAEQQPPEKVMKAFVDHDFVFETPPSVAEAD